MAKKKKIEVKTLYQGPVNGAVQVTIPASPDEVKYVANAIDITDRWKRKAREAAKHKEDLADFTMYKFCFEGNNQIQVTIEFGACG